MFDFSWANFQNPQNLLFIVLYGLKSIARNKKIDTGSVTLSAILNESFNFWKVISSLFFIRFLWFFFYSIQHTLLHKMLGMDFWFSFLNHFRLTFSKWLISFCLFNVHFSWPWPLMTLVLILCNDLDLSFCIT